MTTSETSPVKIARVRWVGSGIAFEALAPNGRELAVDGPPPLGKDAAPEPTDLLLVAVGSCSGISAISLLTKMRQPLEALEIEVSGERQVEWPKAFTSINLAFSIAMGDDFNVELVNKAVDMAVRRYCPVSATIELGEGGCSVEYDIKVTRSGMIGQQSRGTAEDFMNELRDITDDGDMRATLSRLLREAEKAHGQYEQTLGKRDDNWPDWYAEYVLDHLPEQG